MARFANVLKMLRISKGYTQQGLADKLHISRSSVGMYESGEREPDFETLELIADFFNVSIDYLMGKESRSIYYLDPEAAEMAQELYERPELRVLFKASRNVSKESIEAVTKMIESMKKEGN